jgi:hypothetical protein
MRSCLRFGYYKHGALLELPLEPADSAHAGLLQSN